MTAHINVCKIIELSQQSNLPKCGWIQACMTCACKTSRLYDYKIIEGHTVKLDIKAYLCPDCKKNLTDISFVRFLHKKCEEKLKKLNIFEIYNKYNMENELYLPVEPNPPAPRLVSSKSSTLSI